MACPICTRESAARYRPFCSRRCADVDLGRWLNGVYTTPSQDQEALAEAEAETARRQPRKH